MNRCFPVLVTLCGILFLSACSKKTQPTQNVETVNSKSASDTIAVVRKPDSTVFVKPVAKKRKVAESVPKVITVNDQFAKKSVDGRYYYDLQGHRYWRSNKDGKYYLFNKSMLNDAAFKKPQ